MAQRTGSPRGAGPPDTHPVPPVPNAGRAALQGDDRGLSAFSPIRIRRASDEVLAVLVDAIRGGLYDVGDALPPERDLAERLQISRKVLREALDRLRREGIVTAQRGLGGGTVIASLENLTRVCASIQGETRASLRSLLEVRRPLEWTAALLAAQRATPQEWEWLRRLVGMLDELVERPKEFWEIDIRFHFTIAEISGNQYCANFLRATFNQMSVMREQFPYAHVPHPQAIQNQQDTLEAMESRDPDRILASIDAHLAALEDVLLGHRLTVLAPRGAPVMFGNTGL
jgi:GntR family transcriptional regulator, transcriptional repressor for pyruvate dehydrogenase complex